MFYCAEHLVAFETPRQWSGHCLHAHPDGPRPKAEDVATEQVPEGTKIVAAPAGRPRATREPPPPRDHDDRTPLPPPPGTPAYEDEDETHLDQLLDGIGVPQAQRQTIVKGWRIFPVLRMHPGNLENHILGIVGPKFRGQVRLVVDAMFPGNEEEVSAPQYMYGRSSYDRRAPEYWMGRRPAPYQRPWDTEPPPYTSYYRPPPPADNAEANPQMVALQKQLDGIIAEQQAERAERAKEKQEQQQKDRDAAWQGQLNAVVTKVDDTFREFSDLVKGLGTQIQAGKTDVATSHTQQLVEKVEALQTTLASDREERLVTTVESLRSELAVVHQKLNAEPTGKTTEDLISSAIPLLGGKIDALGTAVKGELKEIREQAADGKLPTLTPPTPPGAGKPGDQVDPVKTAQNIAGARAIEDEILAMTGGQPRS